MIWIREFGPDSALENSDPTHCFLVFFFYQDHEYDQWSWIIILKPLYYYLLKPHHFYHVLEPISESLWFEELKIPISKAVWNNAFRNNVIITFKSQFEGLSWRLMVFGKNSYFENHSW